MRNLENNTAIKEKSIYAHKILRLSVYLLMTFYALSVTMIGPMMPVIVEQFRLKLSQGGLIMTFQSIGGLLITIVIGFIADRFRKSSLIVTGFAIYIVSLFTISLAPVYSLVLALFFLFGIGTKIVDTLTNAFLSDLYPEKKGVYLNLLHTFFGFGALAGPLFARFLMDSGLAWELIFRILSFGCIAVLIMFIVVLKNTSDINQKREEGQPVSLGVVLRNKNMWFLCIIMFLYVGHQSGLTVWSPMYMESFLKASPFMASLSLSIFWVGIIIGRLSCSYLSRFYTGKNLIKWGSISAGIILISGIMLTNSWVLILSLGLVGVLTGAFIPLIIDIAAGWFPHNTGAVTSMVYLTLNLGLMFFPWFIGLMAELINFQWAIMLTGIVFPVIFGFTYFIKE